MQSMSNPVSAAEPGPVPSGYRLAGRFLEACDCFAVCPCWIDEVADEGECTGVFVWDITNGEAKGHDVSGLRVASVSFHEGKRSTARQSVVLLIDDRGNDSQASVLGDVFSGRCGGPLGDLGMMLGELVAQRRAKIDIAWDGQKAILDIEGSVKVSHDLKYGPSGRVTTLVDPALAVTFGSPAHVGVSKEFKVDLPDLKASIDLKGRSATTGWFSYTA
jgi:hypothetical protein